jgi:predicted nucleic acid-binding Zn ribbon protein
MREHGRPAVPDGGEAACGECGASLGEDVSFCPECGAAVGGTLAEYCRVCGGRFDPDDRFCSDCGTVRNPDETDASTAGDAGDDEAEHTEEDIEAFRSRVQAYLAEGWKLEHDYGDSVVLVDRGWGNLLVHVILLLFTGGIGNLVYAWYSYKAGAERRRLSADENPAEPAPAEAIDGDDTGGTGRILGGALLLFLGMLFIISDPLDLGNWLFGLALLAGGLYVFPPTRRRIDRRHPATRFGKVRTTDESIVSAPGTPCVVCGRPVENGIRRTFREEIAVAGVPVVTTRDGENHYCEACSMVDPGMDTSGLSVGASGSTTVESTTGTEAETS